MQETPDMPPVIYMAFKHFGVVGLLGHICSIHSSIVYRAFQF